MKYEITNKSITTQNGVKLFRIKALESFSDVKEGDIGGFIEKESNLSQKGRSWVYDNAKVYGDAEVYEDAWIYDDAQVYGNAKIYGHAHIFGKAEIYDEAEVYDNVDVYGNAKIYGNANVHRSVCVYDHARIYGKANVSDDVQVYDNAEIYGEARVYNIAHIYGNAKVYEYAEIYCKACVFDDTHVCGNAKVFNEAWISGDKWPTSPFYLCLREHSITSCSFTQLKIGCEIFTIEELKERGEEIGKENGYSDETIKLYKQAIELVESHIDQIKKGVQDDE